MSIQEANLKAIADAIREKEGSAEPIPAGDFAERIRAMRIGGDVSFTISITAPPNKVSYNTGSLFDPAGMSVWAEFSNGYGLYVNHADLVFDPAGPLEEGTQSVTVSFSWGGETAETEQAIGVKNAFIYGVEWDGGPGTKWTRTDDSAGFTDPVPAVNNGTGSSPFDHIMPWAGMVREERAGGVEVKEPKYWFKWTKTGKAMKLQIANGPVEGFHVDPVNMDRGDGLGELDFSYIGRYRCGDSWTSVPNEYSKVYSNRNQARERIHNLGANYWQSDFAQFWYIRMLYLVEFADWDSQATIGLGGRRRSAPEANGATDAMAYHTGTSAEDRNTSGVSQYRNIESLWDNHYEYIDGCYCGANGLNVIMDPNKFSDDENGVLVGMPVNGFSSEFAIPDQSGFEWALYPIAAGGSDEAYTTDYWNFLAYDTRLLYFGNTSSKSGSYGLFYVGEGEHSISSSTLSSRLQERPPKAAS